MGKNSLVIWVLSSLGLVGSSWTFFHGSRPAPVVVPPSPLYYSQSGRDAAAVDLIRSAHTSILVRTSELECVPLVNELIQKAQDGVSVHLEMPTSGSKTSENLLNVLIGMPHVTLELSSLPRTGYQGAYLLIDGRELLYSASPLNYGVPNAPQSFVRGSHDAR